MFTIGGDCSQGGLDSNFCQFISKTKLDIPLVYEKRGVAAEMTAALYPVLNKIFDITGVKPFVALERNNGGASEMERLSVLNRDQKYVCFVMPVFGDEDRYKSTTKLGWDTNAATRPILLQEWKNTYDNKLLRIYDKETLEQHKTFIISSNGKPEAAKGKHDDAVIACGVAWQVFNKSYIVKASTNSTGGIPYDSNHRTWGVYGDEAYR